MLLPEPFDYIMQDVRSVKSVVWIRMKIGNPKKSVDGLKKSDKGAYILEFRLEQPLEVQVGKLGLIRFEPGWYYYVGSAMNGLKSRLQRHIDGTGKLHWHIDYLRRKLPPSRIWYVITDKHAERQIAELVSSKCESGVIGFGCSDDPASKTHLFFSKRRKNFRLRTGTSTFSASS
jgi:Uri superfamily endonuclease